MPRHVIIVTGLAVLLAGCSDLPTSGRDDVRRPVQRPAQAAPAPAPRPVLTGPATQAAALDTVSEAQKSAARAAAATAPAGGELGVATVSLGNPTDPGLWVKTDLVSSEMPGTVRTGSGEAIAVTLRPLGGTGGAQISLSAAQALGLPLAGLHPVTLARAG
ncbi:hypothetical protein JSE7799_00852 [Jannaschia seosinensis]|uniref:D-galactarate dehydratase n=1 Tax=Jannaschia seosinensis TaxID=313367 RepID=A0A0M7B5S0_9RHOB|nr:hypothetical protein [Jannaschia seosinensis]CUH29711.1 hypothetical protein JSE7799_00852 [Jannaschia seosinensis]